MSGILLLGSGRHGTAASTWQTTYSRAFTSNQSGLGGTNLRCVIGSSDLAFSGSNKVRVTLVAATAAGFVLDAAAIGHGAASGDTYDFDGAQIALTFAGGNAGVTCSANSSVLSDEMTFALNNTKNFVVAAHFSSGSTRIVSAAGTTDSWQKTAASEVLTSDVTGYSDFGGFNWLVSLIEVS